MLYTAFILGLLGSFHCVGMCAPIGLMLPLRRDNQFIKTLQIFTYQLGKATTYVFLGLLFGLIGKGLFIREYQQTLSIIIGVLMIVAVLLSFFKISTSRYTVKPVAKFISKVKTAMAQELRKKKMTSVFTIGFLNGFLPCGLVYMALFGALAQSSVLGSISYMLMFALGTAPLMTTAVFLGNFLSINARNYIQKAIPVFVIIIGILFILRGLGLGIPYISPSNMHLMIQANPGCIVPISNN